MIKKYIVRLSKEEKEQLHQMLRKGKHAAKKLCKARVLLKADSGLSDIAIASACDVTVRTIESMRKQFVEEGLENFLNGWYSNRQYFRKLDGKQEAQLIAMTCSEPPSGRSRWTLHLLANKMVELKYVGSISHETVRKTLKKMN